MIVDCHTHINCPGDDVDPSGHLAATETVDSCIVLALPPLLSARRPASRRETRGQATADKGAESSREVNEKLSEYVSKHKSKKWLALRLWSRQRTKQASKTWQSSAISWDWRGRFCTAASVGSTQPTAKLCGSTSRHKSLDCLSSSTAANRSDPPQY